MSAPLLAQDGATAATVHGTVVNALTRQPIARALVTLQPGSASALTDREGRFSFTGPLATSPGAAAASSPGGTGVDSYDGPRGVAPSAVTLIVHRPGYFGDEAGDREARRSISVLGANLPDLTIALTPECSITGELLLPPDDLPDTLQLQLLRRQVEDGRSHWTTFRSAETTADGHFRFGNLPPGAYLLHSGVSMDPSPAQEPDSAPLIRYGYTPVFYPGVHELAAAAVTNLGPGQSAELRLSVTREPFYPVTLPVANAAGARNLGFTVSNDTFLGLPGRYSPDDNLVHLELPAGHYQLEGRSYGPASLAGVRDFDVNAARTRAGAITLTPPLRIPVVVHDELAHPAPAPPPGESRVLAAPDKLNLSLDSDDDGLSSRGSNVSLQPDRGTPQADRGILENVTPGRYRVVAHAYNGYVASLTSGGLDLLASPLTVSQDGAVAPIEATLRDDFGSLSATLGSTLREQAAGGTLFLQLIPRSGGGVDQVVPFSADGTLQVSNLPPGNYFALATLSRQQVAYRDPQALAALGTAPQPVTVDPGGAAHITVDTLASTAAATAPGAP